MSAAGRRMLRRLRIDREAGVPIRAAVTSIVKRIELLSALAAHGKPAARRRLIREAVQLEGALIDAGC